MTKRMLIDATHTEETRVVMLDGSRIEDYDVENASRKQLKGNIYLAKVVRVEPSLQAAFVEYGGNRHGFLAFDEIHPDYYQIPIADREKLLAMQEAEERAAAAAEEAEASGAAQSIARDTRSAPLVRGVAPGSGEDTASEGFEPDATDLALAEASASDGGEASGIPPASLARGEELDAASADDALGAGEAQAPSDDADAEDHAPEAPPETVGGEAESTEDLHPAHIARHFLRQYKIQEVIHRRQIVLVQVVKEERGAKGAALTTYISLAGRYCVLMPNSPRGGGVSRKITTLSDRKRLREIIAELAIPDGMGLIVRTAGANRPKPEIRRDCEYLLRLWDDIRDTVMKSVAPTLVYEEANLIKRAIRDVYSRDVEEVLVDGEAGWQAAREFMRMLMPAHARKVILWQDGGQSLFAHEHVEAELDATLSPVVPLRSGGSLVINQAEALVAIDVNSGRSTRERNIEETALRTNLEAAEEVARQLRLRDLAGLIVIDFIDMEVRKHNTMVERRLKEGLKGDRARVQVGRISHFGLLEMSRQRLHPSVAEASSLPCPSCGGTGRVRSVESSAVHLLRALEDEALRGGPGELAVHAATAVAFYILNHKRSWLSDIESRHTVSVSFTAEADRPVSLVAIERVRGHAAITKAVITKAIVSGAPEAEPPTLAAANEEPDGRAAADATAMPSEEGPEEPERHHRRHRRHRGRRDDAAPPAAFPAAEAAPVNVPPEFAEQPEIEDATPPEDEQARAQPRPAGRRGQATRRPRREARGRAARARPASPQRAEPSAPPSEERAAVPPDIAAPLAPPAREAPPEPAAQGPTARAGAAEGAPMSPPTPPEASSRRPHAPIDDRPPTPAVLPVIIGSERDRPAVKKRGWWRA